MTHTPLRLGKAIDGVWTALLFAEKNGGAYVSHDLGGLPFRGAAEAGLHGLLHARGFGPEGARLDHARVPLRVVAYSHLHRLAGSRYRRAAGQRGARFS